MQTNLENLMELLTAIGYSSRIQIDRIAVVPVRYDLLWQLPSSVPMPSGPTIEDAAAKGLEIVFKLVKNRREECVSAIFVIDRIYPDRPFDRS